MTRLRVLTGLLLAPVLVLSTAAASSSSRSVPIPDDFQPEGVAVEGSTFYVGSLKDGDIYRGDLETGKGEVFIDVTGRAALGMKVDAARQRLFVAGGPSGRGYVYGLKKGRTLATFRFTKPGQTLVNDVVVTKRAAYFTDSFAPRIYKVPIAPDGSFGRSRTVEVSGPAAAPTDGFGLNGIDATHRGKTLVVAHSAFGAVFTVNPHNGKSRRVAVTKGTLVPGTVDGILLDGKHLWVVENAENTLVKLQLSSDLRRAQVTASVRDPLFRFPTTVADYGCKLALVNARFDLGLPPPFGPGAPAGTDFDVVVLKKP
jgi:sugar lactone lactonase YvrE